jgi:hypothetical protein
VKGLFPNINVYRLSWAGGLFLRVIYFHLLQKFVLLKFLFPSYNKAYMKEIIPYITLVGARKFTYAMSSFSCRLTSLLPLPQNIRLWRLQILYKIIKTWRNRTQLNNVGGWWRGGG